MISVWIMPEGGKPASAAPKAKTTKAERESAELERRFGELAADVERLRVQTELEKAQAKKGVLANVGPIRTMVLTVFGPLLIMVGLADGFMGDNLIQGANSERLVYSGAGLLLASQGLRALNRGGKKDGKR